MKKSISLIQMEIQSGNPISNRKKALELIKQAMDNKPDIIVLPEMWTTAYELDKIHKICDNEAEPTLGLIKQTAQEHNVNIVAGSFANQVDNKVYNTSYTVNSSGQILGKYNKIHLFKLMNEDKYMTSGSNVCTFMIDEIKCGVIICYDLRFPELTRKLALQGIKILFVPAQWPGIRESHWVTLLKARAIENQIYVVAVNRAGTNENDEFLGCSMIIDPWGECLAKADYKEQIINKTIDISVIDEVRSKINVFGDRIPKLY